MKKLIIFITIVLSLEKSRGAIVDTVSIYSNSMKKESRCVVIRPSLNIEKTDPLPVIYLLHGYGGWYSNWIIRVPQLTTYADTYRMMIVCPDGANSWYFDSPVDPAMRYETYIAKEVPDFIDAHYATIKNRSGRAVSGLSMGGHGALFLAFRNADRFGACGSMSGGVDLTSAINKYDLQKRLGDTVSHLNNWKNYSVVHVVEHYPKDSLAIMIDCGISDFFYKDNRALHEKLVKLNVPHDYVERPGKHEWPYWRNAIKYQLLFFRDYFDRVQK
jgi:S-formylglutathione hydrolase FrmB